MVDFKKLLDIVIAAITPPAGMQSGAKGALGGLANQIEQKTGQSPDHIVQKAKDLAAQHPGLTQAALLGLAGLMLRKPRKGGVTSSLAKLGGLAVIGGLAYKAYQSIQGQKTPAAQQPLAGVMPGASGDGSSNIIDVPQTSRFHPVSQTEDDAMLFLRTMIAAAAADGSIDEAERSRIIRGLTEAGIDPQASRWLEDEMTSPADVEELAAGVTDPEKAAQVYAAARIAIDPDTIQEREFLHQLANALDLDQALRVQVEETVGAMR